VFSSLPANRPTKFRALLSGAQIREHTLTTGALAYEQASVANRVDQMFLKLTIIVLGGTGGALGIFTSQYLQPGHRSAGALVIYRTVATTVEWRRSWVGKGLLRQRKTIVSR
jgi:hypothetical protein